MVLKRNLKKLLVFTLTFIFDQYQEFSIKNYYRSFYFPGAYFTRESLHKLVYKMAKVKEIEKIQDKGDVYLKLTSKGGKFFDESISLQSLSQREWDRIWRLVIFDIKEIERKIRNRIRKKLKSWGFAMWQESVYISPHPILPEIDEFLKSKKLFPKVVTLEARLVGVKNPKKFAWVIFKLKNLYKDYLNLEKKINKLEEKKDLSQIKTDLFFIIEEFKNIVLNDPFLPKGLIEEKWPRERIKKRIKNLLKVIEKTYP